MNTWLPTREDFGGGQEAEYAWEDFGGKTLEDVYALLRRDPFSLYEHFMWMGERAFRFYYPVLDRYFRSLQPLTEDDLPWMPYALAIGMHFDCHEDLSGLHESIISLCDYVTGHLDHFSEKDAYRDEQEAAWIALRQQVADDAHGIRKPRE